MQLAGCHYPSMFELRQGGKWLSTASHQRSLPGFVHKSKKLECLSPFATI